MGTEEKVSPSSKGDETFGTPPQYSQENEDEAQIIEGVEVEAKFVANKIQEIINKKAKGNENNGR